jgi:hypothetical protein
VPCSSLLNRQFEVENSAVPPLAAESLRSTLIAIHFPLPAT